jgi:hypothetical protein
MFKRIVFLAGAIATLTFLPDAHAQISEQEFQMGRAREACIEQAQRQLLIFNNVVSTVPTIDANGQMTGSEVILNVGRQGVNYDVRCTYDNASRIATIFHVSSPDNPGGPSDNTTALPTQGTFVGRGLAGGSVFGNEREADASLNFNGNNFSFSLAVPPGTGTQVQYSGTINRLDRTGTTANSGSFTLRGRVRSFASSANNLQVINVTGDCQVEVFDSRVVLSTCNTRQRDSATRFEGLRQF